MSLNSAKGLDNKRLQIEAVSWDMDGGAGE